ncbi:MAG: L-seryl-tRNA(Sec) selenium transferase [Anaerolineae bacterium]
MTPNTNIRNAFRRRLNLDEDRSRVLRELPSVDALLGDGDLLPLINQNSRPVVGEAVREALEAERERILAGAEPWERERLVEAVTAAVRRAVRASLEPVINATGVIVHTNLGRAPLSEAARSAMEAVAAGYSNLEYDLEAGKRGSRYVHAQDLLTRLTGAEDALVVNNNAAALLLILTAMAPGREVVISRSQLVEIGGGFRIPDVMAQSGARLVEVGTTNRTYIADYANAVGEETAALLRVHWSNFRIVGFTHQASLEELAALGRERGIPLIDDLGSGALLDTAPYGLAHEPMAQESVKAAADLVCFSGDKLLGGPQAGLILGKSRWVDRLREHPLARTVRVDKTTLAGLQATLLHYLRGEAEEKIPVWRMISQEEDGLRERADAWVSTLAEDGVEAEVISGRSAVGGGSLPEETLPSWLVSLVVPSADRLSRRLREGDPPIVARVEDGRLILDPRTVQAEQDELLISGMRNALSR